MPCRRTIFRFFRFSCLLLVRLVGNMFAIGFFLFFLASSNMCVCESTLLSCVVYVPLYVCVSSSSSVCICIIVMFLLLLLRFLFVFVALVGIVIVVTAIVWLSCLNCVIFNELCCSCCCCWFVSAFLLFFGLCFVTIRCRSVFPLYCSCWNFHSCYFPLAEALRLLFFLFVLRFRQPGDAKCYNTSAFC